MNNNNKFNQIIIKIKNKKKQKKKKKNHNSMNNKLMISLKILKLNILMFQSKKKHLLTN